MNTQELVDQNIRLLLGDLQVQLVLARTRITELEMQLADTLQQNAPEIVPETAPNGADHTGAKTPKRGAPAAG